MTDKRAAIFTRISRDAEGERLGVERQLADCEGLAQRLGLKVVARYEENNLSASTQSKKMREVFDGMLQAGRRGEFDVVLAYSNSRLTRRLRDLLDLIDYHDETGVEFVTVVSGSDDLSTADGRMVAQIKGSVDEAEARRISERLKNAFAAKAAKGAKNQGVRPFGWGPDKVALHVKESRALRQVIDDVIDGIPTREAARGLNAAGFRTVAGNEWNHTNLRGLLRNPRLAGWRIHQRAAKRAAGIGGWQDLVARDENGAMVRGEWEPMVTDDTFAELQAALDGRRPGSRRGSQKYLLSGVMRCGECGSGMHGSMSSKGHASYECSGSTVGHSLTITCKQTDALVVALVQARLETIDLSGEPVAAPEWPGEERLRQIPMQIKELMDAYNSGVLSAIVFPQISKLEAEQRKLEKERPTKTAGPRVASADAFVALDLDRQRAVIESVVETIVVKKAAHRGARWSPDRLQVIWR